MEPEATEKQAAITPDGDKGANDDTSDRADGIVNPVEAEIDVEVGGGMEVICLNEYPLGKVTLEHIISLIGSYENEEAISSRRTRVQEGKDAVRAFAYETIQRIMIDTARTRNMQINGQLVRTFKDCLSSWAQDGTTDQQRCIYEMTYGYFDRNPKWDLELEKEFMQDRNLHYCDSSIHDEAASNKEENANKRGIKGCIARLLGSVKIDLVKRIRRKGERTHGVCINISRDNSEIDDSNRYRKRRKGTEFRVVMKQKKPCIDNKDGDDEGEAESANGSEDHVGDDNEEKVLVSATWVTIGNPAQVNEDDATDSCTSSDSGKAVIHRNEYPKEKVTEAHIMAVFGDIEDEGVMRDLIERVKKGKDDVRTFAYESVQHLMVENARALKMVVEGKLVNSFEDCMSSWARDGSSAQQQRVYEITYGYFDRNPKWDIDLEKKFMKNRKLRYCDEEISVNGAVGLTYDVNTKAKAGKGCIARLMGDIKIDLVKRIRKKGERTHGICIKISRDSCDINSSNRYRKRKKGTEFRVVVKGKKPVISDDDYVDDTEEYTEIIHPILVGANVPECVAAAHPADENTEAVFICEGCASGTEAIRLNEYPVGKVTKEHVVSLIGNDEDEEAIYQRLTRVQIGKDNVRSFAYSSIRRLMVEKARSMAMEVDGQLVISLEDCMLSWAQDCSSAQQRCIYEMTYGYFDKNPKWDIELEQIFMKDRKLHYCEKAVSPDANLELISNKNKNRKVIKGCIARLIADVKADLVKRIRSKGQGSHGVCIKISRESSEINDTNRYRKRKSGDELYIVVKSKPTSRETGEAEAVESITSSVAS